MKVDNVFLGEVPDGKVRTAVAGLDQADGEK